MMNNSNTLNSLIQNLNCKISTNEVYLKNRKSPVEDAIEILCHLGVHTFYEDLGACTFYISFEGENYLIQYDIFSKFEVAEKVGRLDEIEQ